MGLVIQNWMPHSEVGLPPEESSGGDKPPVEPPVESPGIPTHPIYVPELTKGQILALIAKLLVPIKQSKHA